jgi:hypothetical protein
VFIPNSGISDLQVFKDGVPADPADYRTIGNVVRVRMGTTASTAEVQYTISSSGNPIPVASGLNPSSATAGDSAFTLTVSGNGFIPNSVVRWNGVNRATTYVSSNQIRALISSADIAVEGAASITVFNPAPGGGISNGQNFSINAPGNPMPAVTSLSPASATAGDSAFTLTVSGNGFIPNSVVRWNGVNRATTYVSSNEITASISSADLAVGGTANVTVFNPAPGGGISNARNFTINNPVPATTSLSPASATAGGLAFALTVNGNGFIPSSVVLWNGADCATTFASTNEIIALVAAENIATAGMASITVFNPGPGGDISNARNFTINNPVPAPTSLSPASATAGGPEFTLTVNGSGFVSGSVVRWNGAERATTYVSSEQITASISAADIAVEGTVSLTVINPAPGGGISNPTTYWVNTPAIITSISPSSRKAGRAGFTITLKGSGFTVNSVLRWNGMDRKTTVVSSTKLTAAISASDIAVAGTPKIEVFTPAPGEGVLSNPGIFTINNPAPEVRFLDPFYPSSTVAGGEAFILKVKGSGFVQGSVVRWNGADRATIFVSPEKLRAAIPASDIALAGKAEITVFNGSPGGGISDARTFKIKNPLPMITDISPSSSAAGSDAFTLVVNGEGFVAGSVVRWNGEDRPTLFVSDTQLNAEIMSADIAVAGSARVKVFNPSPGGGSSIAQTFITN